MMFSFYVLHFYFCLRAPFLERFACIPSSPWLLGFSHGFIFGLANKSKENSAQRYGHLTAR